MPVKSGATGGRVGSREGDGRTPTGFNAGALTYGAASRRRVSLSVTAVDAPAPGSDTPGAG
jgi:L,D-peptidoglycan transpeptidase YkuD (ErfK/YbiS/YcfS/YnhG family)